MSGWTESTLRGAASWKAFKDGKSLCDAGAATALTSDASGWQGTVRDGKRLLRVSVRIHSASDVDTRCGCPENQSSGAVCAHAVAVGLAVLRGSPAPTSQRCVSQPPPSSPPQAWDILFPDNWRDALARGKLAATLSRHIPAPPPLTDRLSNSNVGIGNDGGQEAKASASASVPVLTPADLALNSWLAAADGRHPAPLHLQLSGSTLAAFLEALCGHPRIFIGKHRLPLDVRPAGKYPLQEITHHHHTLLLVPDPEFLPVFRIAGQFWHLGHDTLTRLGCGELPADLAIPLAKLLAGHSLELPAEGFLSRLECWQEWLGFPANSWPDSLHFVAAPFSVKLSLEGSLQHLDARLSLLYSGASPVPPGCQSLLGFPRLIANQGCEIRDPDLENRPAMVLAQAGFLPRDPATGLWSLQGETPIIHFLTHVLPSLRRNWSVTENDPFRRSQHQVALVEPVINILGSGEDWLSFNLTFQSSDGIQVSAAEVRQLLRSGKANGATSNGRRIVVSSAVSELLDPLFAELDLRQSDGHYTSSARSGELILEMSKIFDKSFKTNREELTSTFQKPASIHADLRPYQGLGTAWLWDRVERFGGALLADDMGLGKTLQAIALIERLFEALPPQKEVMVLVVATATLLGNWRAEFARFAPARRVRTLHGQGREGEREKAAAGEVILTSFSTMARDLAWHLRQDYELVVVDEASLMRNPDTDHAKALSKLRAKRRIALTGTPVENGVRDLWSIFHFILPGWLGSRQEFRERYEIPLLSAQALPSLLERLRLKTSPFLLRRTKQQVAPDLPSLLMIDEFCDLSAEQQGVYRELLIEGRKRVDVIMDSGNPGAARMQLLTALLRLRQTCCDLALLGSDRFKRMLVSQRSAKLQRLLELLEEALSGGHKVLVFSQFRTQLLEIEKCLMERGFGSMRLDGQSRNRQELVERFQSDGGPPIFLISLKAGGYGLNLTAADTVIHFDPWWNPSAEAQASDRAHRIGQIRPVTVYRLLTRGTVEEKVLRLQARKRLLSAAIDESGMSEGTALSDSELLAMMDDGR